MNWKHLIIATAEIEHRKISIQFEVFCETITQAEKMAKEFMKPFFEIDVIEIRRV